MKENEMNETTFTSKCEILADLWLNYRDDDEAFGQFITYCDLALPLAYAYSNAIITERTEQAIKFIDEAWTLLLSGIGLEDTGFDSLDSLLDNGNFEG